MRVRSKAVKATVPIRKVGVMVNELDSGATKQEPFKKPFTIIVNARETTVAESELTFEALVALAFPEPPYGVNTAYTVTYRRGQGNKPVGSMVEGNSVKLKDGMVFNVTATDKS